MARPKKGQIFQFCVPARSSSDGSLITTMTASDFNSGAVQKWFGVNHGVSDAFTSGTLSKAARLVSSGLMQITLNATENAYDEMTFRARKTSMRPMFAAWNNADYDDSDMMSRLSDVASDLRSYAVETRSQLSDVQSYLVAMSGALSDVESQLDLVPTVNNSDAISNVYSQLLLVASSVSDVQSALSDAHSDLASKIGGITVSISASDVSDIASAVVAGLPIASVVSDIYSLLSDLDSNFNSRVPKEVSARSQLSDLSSDLRSYVVETRSQLSDVQSYLVAMSTALSDVESQVDLIPTANNSDAISNVYSLLALVASNVSDVESQLDLVPTVNNSGAISDIYSLLVAGPELGSSSMSDIRSAVLAGPNSNVKKNQALANFTFLMTDDTDHEPLTGLTVTCERSIDGAAFGTGTLANVAEVANGLYKVDFGAGDLNGNVIVLKATATGADATFERIVTTP